jgi:transposase-like protein
LEIIRTEPRRRWTREEKMAAAAACFEPGATVTGVARVIGVNPSMVFAWRKQFRTELGFPEERLPMAFAPVALSPDAAMTGALAPPGVQPARPVVPGVIELAFAGSVRLRIEGAVGPDLAAAVIKALAKGHGSKR